MASQHDAAGAPAWPIFFASCSIVGRFPVLQAVIPLTQIDLADATGLSPVHINRTIYHDGPRRCHSGQ
jgi:hypothetical protein